MPEDALAAFTAPTRAWFTDAFAAPTAAQAGAWAAVGSGHHALVVAPTGSGKTLAAFLWAIDRIIAPRAGAHPGRVLYVSPLKALAADVEKNLRSPLTGIRAAAHRAGLTLPEVSVGTRTGDTPQSERRALAVRPPDILITTPESLFLVLTSGAREGLREVGTVIVDEIHAVAGTKRGAHLAVSLERLDALLERPAQRIGLSATVRPVAAVAEFLAGARPESDGGRPLTIVQPPSTKQIDVQVVVPVPDLTHLAADPATGAAVEQEADLSGSAVLPPARTSIWPHVEERVVDLVAARRSTIVFTNSRRSAERLTARMNEIWARRNGLDVPDPGAVQPAAVMASSGATAGAEGEFARAHHGSMSRAERLRTENALKAGTLPAVVATSSLELGIDMGEVDLVVQIGSPPSVASGLQRVGRAGHQVDAVSHGVVLPLHRGDLVPAAVTAGRMRTGRIERLHVVHNPLDVLAQQIVAMVAMDDWEVPALAALVRASAPFAGLGEGALHAVLDMLAGRYPSEQFGELRARITWDRSADVLRARPGSMRLAVTSGGTIPDRGLYGVFLDSSAPAPGGTGAVGDEQGGGRTRGGKRVGELDEEMVYESRVGDTFTLGSSTWRITDITPDRVLVVPAPGLPGRLPFWKGDSPGRPAALGHAIGQWVRGLDDVDAPGLLSEGGLDEWAAQNLLAYLREQREATGVLPDDRRIVVERFRDELGDWRVAVHSPYGSRVHAPWALVLGARLRNRYGVDVSAMHTDDGIVLRLPEADVDGAWLDAATPPQVDLGDLLIEAEEVSAAVRAELGGSTLFAARFREAAARALLLPRRRPDRRQPLWQQRQRGAQLLQVAAQFPRFPIMLEAARECLQDEFDVAALTELMAQITAGTVEVTIVDTASPSPFAQALLFSYTAEFLYDGDAPLAERRAAALTVDPTLLDELLGSGGGATQVADLLDPASVQRTEAEIGSLTPERAARSAEGLVDLLRRAGPLTLAEIVARTRPAERAQVPGWLTTLRAQRQVLEVRLPGLAAADRDQWAAIEDAGRLRDGLGVALSVGIPDAFTEPVRDPLGDLLLRHARTHGPFAPAQAAGRLGLPVAAVTEVLERLERDRLLVFGRLRPEILGVTGGEFCDPDVLRMLRRRSLAALRAQIEPVPGRTLGRFLPRWHQLGQLRGRAGLLRAVEQLAGLPVPASDLERHLLPVRVRDYTPALLDELTTSGEVLWAGHGTLPGMGKGAGNGAVSLHLAEAAGLTLPDAEPVEQDSLAARVLEVLSSGGAYFLDRLTALVGAAQPDLPAPSSAAVQESLWTLVWSGHVTNDSFGPVRALLGRTPARATRAPRAPRHGRFGLRALAAAHSQQSEALHGGGRWSALPAREADPTVRLHALTGLLLDRHGVVTRALGPVENLAGRFTGVYQVLGALERAGEVRRGYFVEHLGGSQFAVPGSVDLLRELAHEGDPARAETQVLAATDPANPYGAALAWPAAPDQQAGTGHRPGRKAGASVVLADGALALFVERGGRSLLSFGTDPEASCAALADAVRAGRVDRLSLTRVDGQDVFAAHGTVVDALLGAGFAVTPRGLRLAPGEQLRARG
ncbi:MAG: DEAD/DEAH box helicase [Cellulomonadaceae bacterium]